MSLSQTCHLIVLSTITFFCMHLQAQDARRDSFVKLFQYELNNRAFAYISVHELAEKMQDSEQAAFWRAYAQLEQVNRPRYQRMANKHRLEANMHIARLKAWGTGLAFTLFPRRMMSIMTQATVAYVPELKQLTELSDAEDRAFFNYVVAQEEAQAEALALALAERFDRAAEVLDRFIMAQAGGRSVSHRDTDTQPR